MGSVDIRKEVETEQVNVPVELRHEEVTVDRVDVKDRPVAAGDMADAFEEGTIRVPVRGEEAVVEKEAVVTGEVVVDREVEDRAPDDQRHRPQGAGERRRELSA